MIEILVIAVLTMATVFLVLTVLTAGVSLLGLLAQKAGGLRPEQEKELVAMFSALYAFSRPLTPGRYGFQVGSGKRELEVEEWFGENGRIRVAEKSVNIEIEEEG